MGSCFIDRSLGPEKGRMSGPCLLLPVGGPLEICQCVFVNCTGAKADGPETSLGWPCFWELILKSWEAETLYRSWE